MPMILDLARLSLFPALMAFAAVSDLLTMTISNRVSLLLAGAFLVLAVASGMGPTDMLLHVGAGAIVLVGQALDIGTAGPAVDRWNHAHVDVMPTVMPMGEGGYGAGVVGRF